MRNELETWLRVFLPIYLLVWFALAFAWRSYQVWKRTGRNPYRLGKTDSAHDFIGRLFRLTIAACAGVVLVYSFWKAGYDRLVPITWLERPALAVAGLV